MKRFSLWLVGTVFLVGAIPFAARAYWEPPHFSVPPDAPADCNQCHISSPHHSLATYPSGLNELCESCHFDGGPAPGVQTHSSRTSDNGYGNWDLDCWSCHNQHGQEQEEYWPLDPSTYGKYIRRYMVWPPSGPPYSNMYGQIKEIDPLDPGPYYEPLSILREVTSTIVEFKGPSWFVDGDAEADDDICQVCHELTLYYNTGTEKNFHADFGVNSQPGGTCTTCHKHEDGFRASGHSASDFAWNDTTKANCGTADCHDWSSNTNVVADIHKNTCLNCHDNTSGGDGTAIDRDVGFATNGSTTPPHTDECTICHTLIYGHTHHDRSDSYAANGVCTQCHIDPRDDAGYAIQAQIKQLSCRACHVQYSGSTLQIVAIEWAKEGSADATGTAAGNDFRPIIAGNAKKFGGTFISDHTFNNNNGTDETDAIDNYGICFECHGTTGRVGYATATSPVPYHALPIAGGYNASQSVNTIGGNGWSVDNVGNNDGNTGAQFRGGVIWDAVAADAYWPIGKDRINLGYAQHSLAKGATNDVVYQNQNDVTDTYNTLVAGLGFGIQTVDHLSSPNTFAVPHFDSICNSGSTIPCDDITGVAVTDTNSQGELMYFDVTATSSTGADLHIVWGGIEIGTIASGGSLRFRYQDAKADAFDKYICADQFNANDAQPLWIVSEDGGAASAIPYVRGSDTTSVANTTPTCTRIFTQPVW